VKHVVVVTVPNLRRKPPPVTAVPAAPEAKAMVCTSVPSADTV
jgi:hypothetical protein